MLGIIGGTGLYSIEEFELTKDVTINTPYGEPSATIRLGRYKGKEVAFLPRHGAAHSLLPSEVNYRANIYALKLIGVKSIISVSAVGSLKKEIPPGTLALTGQYIDWTKGKRAHTFFGDGMVAHIPTATPISTYLRELLLKVALDNDITLIPDLTYVCVEGPRLGTSAESKMFQHLGFDIVGMTNVPEVFLAREAQLNYITVAISTDYDSWCDDPNQHVSVEKVFELYRSKIETVQSLLRSAIELYDSDNEDSLRLILKDSIVTPISSLSAEKQEILQVLLR